MRYAGILAIMIINVYKLVAGNLKETFHLEDTQVAGR